MGGAGPGASARRDGAVAHLPCFSLKGRKAAAKHVFAGATRIATKLAPPSGWLPPAPTVIVAAEGEPATGSDVPGCVPSDYQPSKCPAYPGGDEEVVEFPGAQNTPPAGSKWAKSRTPSDVDTKAKQAGIVKETTTVGTSEVSAAESVSGTAQAASDRWSR